MRPRTFLSHVDGCETNCSRSLCFLQSQKSKFHYSCCCCCCCWSANTPICSFSISIICSSRCNSTINGTTKTKNVVPNVHAAFPVENAHRMACSLVFSQSRVDFLDAFDESESSVPGTISMLFSILSACLCAWVVSESMTMRSVSFFSLSLFLILMCWGKKNTFFFPLFLVWSIDEFSLNPKKRKRKRKKRENLIMTSAIYGRSSASQRKKNTLSNCENYSWSISKSAYALRKTSDETSSSYSSFKQQNFPIPLLRL